MLFGFDGDAAAGALGLLFSLDLLGVQGFLDPIVGDLDLLLVLFLGVGQVGALADQEVLVSHGVVILGIDRQALVEGRQPGIDDRPVFGLQLLFDLFVLDGTGVFLFHAEIGARRSIGRIPLGPGDKAEAVVGV